MTSRAANAPTNSPANAPANAQTLGSQQADTAVADPVAAIALLDEPRRRALYEYVTARREPVGRVEAAEALGIGRELAAFHLDRLAAAGLLDVEFRRLGGRTGPGAGRPAKLYRRTDREAIVSLPGRDYARAAEVFAEALDHLGREAVGSAVDEVARARGLEAGTAARAGAGVQPSSGQLRAGLIEMLGEAGYEPTTLDDSVATGRNGVTVRLQNCPFHAVVANHRDLTCRMNLAWAQGVLSGLAGTERADGDASATGRSVGLEADLASEPGYCCVVFRETREEPQRRLRAE